MNFNKTQKPNGSADSLVSIASETQNLIEVPEDAVYNPTPNSPLKGEVKSHKRMFVLIDAYANVIGIYGNKKRLFEKIETLIGKGWGMKIQVKNQPLTPTYSNLNGALKYVDSVHFLSPEGKIEYKVCESLFNA